MLNKDKKTLGYIIGTIFGTVCVACLTAILIALTTKLILWIL